MSVKFKSTLFRCAFFWALLLLASPAVFAQESSNKGTDFWLAFMGHDNTTSTEMSLYITSDVNTSGTVSVPLAGWSTNFTVTANTTTVVNVPNTSAYVNSSEVVENKGIRIQSALPVVAYSHIHFGTRSDASLVLPVPTLGKEYYAMCFTQNPSSATRNSEFIIAAVEDSTTIEITPKATTLGGHVAGAAFTVQLNEGQVYQVRATTDLTGSYIRSISPSGAGCKRIAVFSGSTYAYLGCPTAANQSGDNLYQQIYPKNAWGSNFVTAPFLTRTGDYYRVMAGTDGTVVTVNNTVTWTLNAGQFRDTLTSVSNYFTANHPITLAQYQRTQSCDNATAGDPSMTILNPVEQTLDTITLYSSPFVNITGEYINVIMKTADTALFRLDGNHTPFTVAPFNNTYSYSRNTVTSGNHTLMADSGFNAIAYGFGNFESYGYSAGANVKSLDQYISLSSNGIGNVTATCVGSQVDFNAVTDYTPLSYLWYFGDGDTSSLQNPSHIFNSTGTFTISLVTEKPVSNSCSAFDSSAVSLTIIPAPVADFTYNNACLGDTVFFQNNSTAASSSIVTRLWHFGDGDSSTALNPFHVYASLGSYTVTLLVRSATGCLDTVTHVVQITNLTAATAGLDTSFCVGGSVNLAASGGSSYMWSPATGLSSVNTATPTASPASSTEYHVTITAGGCSKTDTVQVVVHALPLADAGANTSICAGGSVTLSASGGVDYLWSPLGTLDSPNISNPVASPASTQSYTVTVTDLNGCVNTDSVNVGLYALPTVTGDTTVCRGSSATLNVSGGVSYAWTPATGLSSVSIANPVATPSATTTYTVSITDVHACLTDRQVQVNVNQLPPVSAGADIAYCIGSSDSLHASGASSYTWSPAAGLSSTAASVVLVNTAVDQEYILTGVDLNSCINSDTVNVLVNPLPTADAGPSLSICVGASTTLSASGGTSYAWSPATDLSATNIANPVASPASTQTYTVLVTDVNGCENIDSVSIDFFALPTAGSDTTLCRGDSVMLQVGGGVAFSWSPTLGLSAANIGNPFAGPIASTTYTVSITDVHACVTERQVAITVNQLPPVSAGSDIAYCIGASDSLHATGAVIYTWSPSVGLSSAVDANVLVNSTLTQDFILTGVDANACSNKDTVHVTVYALPPAYAGVDDSICAGGSTNLLASGGVSYQWSPSQALSDSLIANPLAAPQDTTTFHVLVTDLNGCQASDSMVVYVHPTPIVSIGPDVWICPGDSILLSISGTGGFAWSPAALTSNPSASAVMVSPPDTTDFIVTFTSEHTCVNSDTVRVAVNAAVPVNAGPDQVICLGDTISLGNTPTAPAGSTFLWNPGINISDSLVSNPVVHPSLLTTYIVFVTNDTCHGRDTVVVQVNPLPTPVFAGNDTTICYGQSVTLGSDSVPGHTYSWSSFGGSYSSDQAAPSASPLDTTEYLLVQTILSTGCSDKDTVRVFVNPLPDVHAGTDTVLCNLDEAHIGAVAIPGNSYSWSSVPAGFASTVADTLVAPNDTTSYVLLQTIVNTGCSAIDTVHISVNPLPVINAGPDVTLCTGNSILLGADSIPGNSYVWTSVPVGFNSTESDTLVTPGDSTLYILHQTIIATGCSRIDSVTIDVNERPAVNAGSDTTLCVGATFVLGSDSIAGVAYYWSSSTNLFNSNEATPSVQPAETVTYYLTGASLSTFCNTFDSVLVSVNPLPVFMLSNDATLCAGASIQLSVNGGQSYSWSPSTGLSAANIASPVATPLSTVTYFVTVSDANACASSDSVEILVYPAAIADAGPDNTVCPDASATLHGSGGVSFQWSPNVGLSSASDSVVLASPSDITTYELLVTDANGCTDRDSVIVDVETELQAAFTVGPIEGTAPAFIEFENNSQAAAYYIWEYGDGISDSLFSPNHLYTDSGTYRVVLYAISAGGCRDTAVYEFIHLDQHVYAFIPNIFTPNADGLNELFVVNSLGFASMTGQIFNRWGTLMSTVDFVASGWNGKTNGKVEQGRFEVDITYTLSGKSYKKQMCS